MVKPIRAPPARACRKTVSKREWKERARKGQEDYAHCRWLERKSFDVFTEGFAKGDDDLELLRVEGCLADFIVRKVGSNRGIGVQVKGGQERLRAGCSKPVLHFSHLATAVKSHADRKATWMPKYEGMVVLLVDVSAKTMLMGFGSDITTNAIEIRRSTKKETYPVWKVDPASIYHELVHCMTSENKVREQPVSQLCKATRATLRKALDGQDQVEDALSPVMDFDVADEGDVVDSYQKLKTSKDFDSVQEKSAYLDNERLRVTCTRRKNGQPNMAYVEGEIDVLRVNLYQAKKKTKNGRGCNFAKESLASGEKVIAFMEVPAAVLIKEKLMRGKSAIQSEKLLKSFTIVPPANNPSLCKALGLKPTKKDDENWTTPYIHVLPGLEREFPEVA